MTEENQGMASQVSVFSLTSGEKILGIYLGKTSAEGTHVIIKDPLILPVYFIDQDGTTFLIPTKSWLAQDEIRVRESAIVYWSHAGGNLLSLWKEAKRQLKAREDRVLGIQHAGQVIDINERRET